MKEMHQFDGVDTEGRQYLAVS